MSNPGKNSAASTTNPSEPEALEKGVEWLRTNYDSLLRDFVTGLSAVATPFHQNMSSERRFWIAEVNLDGIINRLSGQFLPADAMKQNIFHAFAQGEQLDDLISSQDKILEVLVKRINNGLANKPSVRDILLRKINYINQVVKAAMTSAAQEYYK